MSDFGDNMQDSQCDFETEFRKRFEARFNENSCDPGGYFIVGPHTKKESPEETINKFYKINEIRELFEDIDNLSYDKLVELKNLLEELKLYYLRKQNLTNYFPLLNPFIDWENEVEEQMKKYHLWFYDNMINFSEQQNVNGYKLYDVSRNIMCIDMFLHHVDLWQNSEQMTKEEFEKEFYDTICTEWYKMDRNGNSFGGFWSFPEDSPEKNDAWNLTVQDNMNAMFDLPYPKKFVLVTIKMGCNNRMECVRYSNMICEWYKQKYDLYLQNKK